MILGPATSFANGLAHIGILTFAIGGFFVTFGLSLWLGNKWFGRSRLTGLPLGVLFSLYLLVVLVLFQFW